MRALGLSVLVLALAWQCTAVQNIEDYGAIENDTSIDASITNGNAIFKAFVSANTSSDRTVLIPAGKQFSYVPSYGTLDGLSDVTFQIDGTILAFNGNHSLWPRNSGDNVYNIFEFNNCDQLTIQGEGTVQGNGYDWWWEVILSKKDNRPHMFRLNQCSNLAISGVSLLNSPQFHLLLVDVENVLIESMRIHVDVSAQRDLLAEHGHLSPEGLPTFPLNTDGIDPSGRNITIRNVSIENFDDAVAVKPSHQGYVFSDCAEDILVEDCTVKYGVGMTIGSVPPRAEVNCVRNVTFRNIKMVDPIKAIYVKTNPGHTGSGIIANVTYENFEITRALWWAIYVGPQQQKQPDGGGPGCFLYPLKPCETQPRVPITNLVFRNIAIDGTILSPGILRCNETNPCHGFVFDNVTVSKAGWFPMGDNYICENISGESSNSNPVPSCFKNLTPQRSDVIANPHRFDYPIENAYEDDVEIQVSPHRASKRM